MKLDQQVATDPSTNATSATAGTAISEKQQPLLPPPLSSPTSLSTPRTPISTLRTKLTTRLHRLRTIRLSSYCEMSLYTQ